MRRSLPLTVVVLVLATVAAYTGYGFAEPFAWFIVGTHIQDVRFTAPAAEIKSVAAGFSVACAFMATAAAVAAALTRPAAVLTSLVALTLLFLLVAGLAFACAAAFYRSEFSEFVLEAGEIHKLRLTLSRPYRTPEVTLADVPIVRVPVIAGLCTLVAGAVTRVAAVRVARRAP